VNRTLAAPLFLARLKPLLAAGKLDFKPRNRRKTLDFMLEHELKAVDAFEIISLLKPEHYQWGPDADDDGTPGSVMLFFYPYDSMTLYIKLKIWQDESGDAGNVLSFHEEGMHE
jgi:hypothetical protein